jgi:hypothetical protein
MDEREENETVPPELRAALVPDSVRSATRARLLARAAADAQSGRPASHAEDAGVRPAGPRISPVAERQAKPDVPAARRRVLTPALAVAALALAASLLFIVRLVAERESLRTELVAQRSAHDRQVDSLRTALAANDELMASLTGPRVRVVGLTSAKEQPPGALMFWDRATNRWTLVAHNLAQLKPGRTYQLWLVTPSEKISAGTFSVTPNGSAVVRATYELDENALKAVAVTEEPAGGVPQPTGAMVIVGTTTP